MLRTSSQNRKIKNIKSEHNTEIKADIPETNECLQGRKHMLINLKRGMLWKMVSNDV